jgi:hypothetical protein
MLINVVYMLNTETGTLDCVTASRLCAEVDNCISLYQESHLVIKKKVLDLVLCEAFAGASCRSPAVGQFAVP